MKLFIGNATAQNFHFHYRLPEKKSVIAQFIPMGEQIQITGDLSQLEVDAIVHQGEHYGMLSVDEVDRRHTRFHGLCYSVGREITSSKIEKLYHANQGVLIDMGREFRKNAAIVENNRMLRTNQEQGLPNIKNTEMSIQEESDTGNGQLAEGYRAEYDTPTPRAPRKRRGAA